MRSKLLLPLVLAACGPRVAVNGPGEEPTNTIAPMAKVAPVGEASRVVIGEMCPEKVAGSAGVSVLLSRETVAWSTEDDELYAHVARGEVPRFAVLGHDGARAGIFTVAGATDVGTPGTVAAGGYAGAGPCDGAEQTACEEAQKGCGLAVGPVGADADERDLDVTTGGACAEGETLYVDIDGDELAEAFGVATLLDDMRAPPDELAGVPAGLAPCTPTFTAYGVIPAGDKRSWRGLDVVGVVDLDGDGRRELVLQYRYGEKRTWAIYSSVDLPARLSLIAELEPWP